MKSRPILVSTPLIQPILGDTKTHTRRGINFLLRHGAITEFKEVDVIDASTHGHGYFQFTDRQGVKHYISPITLAELCPYGQPGDQLWVREEHYCYGHWEPVPGARTKGGRQKWRFVADSNEVRFEAPESFRKGRNHKDPWTPAWHKRLARFMPRSYSRITLEIVSVRVERLQDISEGDSKAEGAPMELGMLERLILGTKARYRSGFARLWESINGPGSWDANPWVWVIEFKRVEGGKG